MDTSDSAPVEAQVNYLTPMTEKPVNYTFQPPPGVPWRSGRPEPHRIQVRNARTLAAQPSLDEQGFVLVAHGTSVRNFHDAAEVRSVYYPEVEKILKAATGAAEVVIFDDTLRSAWPSSVPRRGSGSPCVTCTTTTPPCPAAGE